VRAAVTYRGKLSLDLALDILANVEVAGRGHRRRAGRAAGQRLLHAGALDRRARGRRHDRRSRSPPRWPGCQWSAYPPPPDLDVLVALDITPPLVSTATPAPDFTDTVGARRRRVPPPAARRAARDARRLRLPAIAGAAQTGLTSYADGDRARAGRRASGQLATVGRS
jgi:hypothetical protein